MALYSSFFEVKLDEDAEVRIEGLTFNLGCVRRIHATHATYMVWSDQDDRIWYEIDHAKLELSCEFHLFWSRYQELRCQSLHNLQSKQVSLFNGMLASALASALEKQVDAAEKSLSSARIFLDSSNERVSKRRYLVGVVGSAAISAILSVVLYLAYYFLDVDQVIQILAAAFGGGALGALLSSTTGKIQDARFDPNASDFEGHLNGGLRVLYGLCGALVAIIAVKSGIISSDFLRPGNEKYVLFIIAVAGGFTERHAANLVGRISLREQQL